jgi:hypothetical protein
MQHQSSVRASKRTKRDRNIDLGILIGMVSLPLGRRRVDHALAGPGCLYHGLRSLAGFRAQA